MKSHEEVTNDLLERRDRYVTEQNQKRKKLMRAAASFCCCLAALMGLGLWQSGLQQNEPSAIPDNFIAGDKVEPTTDASVEPSPNPNPPEQPGQELRFLEVESLPEIPSQMYIALMWDDFIPLDHAEINAYYGANIFPAVPDDLARREEPIGIFKRKADGEIYHDGNKIQFANADFSRHLAVNVDKDSMPFDFCHLFAILETRSVMNNVEIGIAQTPLGELYAEFLYRGVGFRIYAFGLTQDEFVSILQSLIQ